MYSAEIAGDEEDEQENKKKGTSHRGGKTGCQKAKEDRQFKWLLYGNSGSFHCGVCSCFYVASHALASLLRKVGASEVVVTVAEAFVRLALFTGYMV